MVTPGPHGINWACLFVCFGRAVTYSFYIQHSSFLSRLCKGKGKVIPLQARCGPEGG